MQASGRRKLCAAVVQNSLSTFATTLNVVKDTLETTEPLHADGAPDGE